MKIAIDGGGVCAPAGRRFGNYFFTKNLIQALAKFDKKNDYLVYSFCQRPDWWGKSKRLQYKILRPKHLWLFSRVSLEELVRGNDIFLALNQAIPFITRGKVIAFSHGLSFYFYPKFYPDSYEALVDQLGPMIKKSQKIIVSSWKVKKEMLKLYPNCRNIKVLNYGIPFDMVDYQPKKRKKYFLYAGMDHPIKNIDFIVTAFKLFLRERGKNDYRLFLVGDLDRFADEKNNIFCFPNLTRKQLKKFYEEAAGYLTASFYESFNIPVLEALALNCPVVGLSSAIIPELRYFATVVDSLSEFLESMRQVSEGRRKGIDGRLLRKNFSWRTYIRKLKSLY